MEAHDRGRSRRFSRRPLLGAIPPGYGDADFRRKGSRAPRQAANIFADSNEILILSAVSVSEIAIKAARGKFDFSFLDLRTAIEDLHLQTLPYTMDHAFCLFDLPLRHTDPFDRQLIAQALGEGIPIVSCDQEFRLYEGLQIVW